MKINNELLQQIKSRIVGAYNPLAIFIFGSYIWGEPDKNSDIDLLVVVKDSKDKFHKRAIVGHKSLRGIKYPFDILVYTKNEFNDKLKNKIGLCNKIKERGKKIYGNI